MAAVPIPMMNLTANIMYKNVSLYIKRTYPSAYKLANPRRAFPNAKIIKALT